MSETLLRRLETDRLARYSARFLLLSVVAQLLRLTKFLLQSKKTSLNDPPKERVDGKIFWSNLRRVLKACFPKLISLECCGVLVECYLIFLRTSVTIRTARTISRAGRHLIESKCNTLVSDLVDLSLLVVPGTIAHVGVWYVRSFVAERMKDNLNKYLSDLYFSGNNIYYIASSESFTDPDRRFLEDSIKFCNTFMNLFESLLKPIVNIVSLSVELSKVGGISAPALIVSYFICVASAKSLIIPDFAALLATAQEHEGKLRTAHNVLIQHAEEVAFYGGEEREKEHADELIERINEHEKKVKISKWILSNFDSLVIKYGSIYVGFIVCGIIVREESRKGSMSKAALTELYFKTSTLCMPFLKALGKLLTLSLKLGAIHGSVQRVNELREAIVQPSRQANQQEIKDKILNEHYISGTDYIEFSNVDIVTPSNVCLISNFSIRVDRNSHLLVRGKNGSGKSAVIRALAGLWPISKGTISVPSFEKIFIVPQRVFFPPGTFKAQLTYPIAEESVDDAAVLNYADSLGLTPVIERVGGLQTKNDWHTILSGGERQRVGLVRVLVHRPQFAILDECTSAVSIDDEKGLYSTIQQAGVTLFTISHHDTLKDLHDVIVEIESDGSYQVIKTETNFNPLGMC